MADRLGCGAHRSDDLSVLNNWHLQTEGTFCDATSAIVVNGRLWIAVIYSNCIALIDPSNAEEANQDPAP